MSNPTGEALRSFAEIPRFTLAQMEEVTAKAEAYRLLIEDAQRIFNAGSAAAESEERKTAYYLAARYLKFKLDAMEGN